MIELPGQFTLEWWQVFFGGVSTLAIFSFLYRENPFYRFFEHLYIGIATGYGIIEGVRSYLWPRVFKPLLGLDRIVFPDGTVSVEYSELNLLWLFPISFGLLYYCLLTKRHKWLAQLVIGAQLGYSSGLAFKGTFTEMMPQIFDSIKPIYARGSFLDSLNNLVFLLILVCSLSYFFFTFQKVQKSRVSEKRAELLTFAWFTFLLALSGIALYMAPRPLGLGALGDLVFLLPITAALACLHLSQREESISTTGVPIVSVLTYGGLLYFTFGALFVGIYSPFLFEVPRFHMSFLLTVICIVSYFFFSFGRKREGVVATASVSGRWMMMACFGAYFGSTIMARMALLVERLDFLINKWLPIF